MRLADQLTAYDATALAGAIAQGRLSAIDVLNAHLERIEALNPGVNALVTLDAERAAERAREADRAVADGRPIGPLHGVPITVKDSIETAGLRTTAGHRPLANHVPERDADVVRALAEAGANLIGKTNCATLCCDVQSSNKLFGRTSNPWDSSLTSGGSSGGEAVAVAMGMSPLGVGSDTGGSIRIPSSYCGVFGMKPSRGAFSLDGLLPAHGCWPDRSDSLTVPGFIARSVRDLALCHSLASGEPVAPPSSRPLRIACTLEFDEQPVDDEVVRELREACEKLAGDDISISFVDSPIDVRALNRLCLFLLMHEFTPRDFNRLMTGGFAAYDAVSSFFMGGRGKAYEKIKAQQAEQGQGFEEFLSGYDCWIIPATPTAAFPHRRVGSRIPISIGGKVRRHEYLSASAGLSYPINFLGNPSVVIPAARSALGLPIGLQVVGRLDEDQELLAIAALIAERIGKFSGAGTAIATDVPPTANDPGPLASLQ